MKTLSFILSVMFVLFVQNANAAQTDVKLEIIDAVVCSQMSLLTLPLKLKLT